MTGKESVSMKDGEDRPLKRTKVEESSNTNDDVDEELIEQVWQHYRNYTDSSGNDDDDENDDGDEDELMEIITLLDGKNIQPISKDLQDFTTLCTKQHLLPVLISVSAYVLAVNAIEVYLQQFEKIQNTTIDDTMSNIDTILSITTIQNNLNLAIKMFPQNAAAWAMAANFARITYRLRSNSVQQTIIWYEHSAKCASTIRTQITQLLDDMSTKENEANEKDTVNNKNSTNDKNGKNNTAENDVKEWIEMLLLNQVTGVELLLIPDIESFILANTNVQLEGDEVDNNDKDETTNKINTKKSCCEISRETNKKSCCAAKNDTENTKETDEQDGNDENNNIGMTSKESWSPSSVEETSRFMLAMLNSMAGNHDSALEQIKFFPHLTHRLHPNVWNAVKNMSTINTSTSTSSTTTSTRLSTDPALYRKTNDTGILPQSLYDELCTVFEPSSPYWIESDYSNRGYYSFYMDVPKDYKCGEKIVATNIIEDVVCNHLLPVVTKHINESKNENKEVVDEEESSNTICGYEWWVHTRPIQANLGHNLHFDTDEHLLANEREISHPIVSSVLYLSGGNTYGGPTIVFNQTPESDTNANKAWLNTPINNSCLVFPGNLLHGVLPCSGHSSSTSSDSASQPPNEIDKESMLDLSKLWNCHDTTATTTTKKINRLTFMVGFWTRRVPDGMKVRKLYGPCGQLPPPPSSTPVDVVPKKDDDEAEENDDDDEQEEHTWVNRIYEGYSTTGSKNESTTTSKTSEHVISLNDVTCADLIVVDNPWEEFRQFNQANIPQLHLETPKGLDHRYFVSNAPQCFTESLYEKDDDDDDCMMFDDDDDDDNEELPFPEDDEDKE